MSISELHYAVMQKEDCSFGEAERIVNEMKLRVIKGENPEEVLYDEGLEPDYFIDLIS